MRRGADGIDRIVSLRDGPECRVTVRRRRVDATHAGTEVPATHPPRDAVAPGVALVAPHQPPRLGLAFARHTVVGGGKTAMDSVLRLLEQGVAPQRIRWIVPRDAWLHDRALLLSGAAHFERGIDAVARELDAVAGATSPGELPARRTRCARRCRRRTGPPTGCGCAPRRWPMRGDGPGTRR